ncbi:MAG: PIN domain-containing protein [Actinomycetota bacterium]
MRAVDTSVAVAAFGEWHEQNEPARAVLDEGAALPAHCLLETYSVLTGFPPPHRAAPQLVEEWLKGRFSAILPPPPAEEHLKLVSILASARRSGGSVYDGLVALTVRHAGGSLVTADERASAIYELVGVDWEMLG